MTASKDKALWRTYLGFGGALVLLIALLGFALTSVTRLSDALELNLEAHQAIAAAQEARATSDEILFGLTAFLFAGGGFGADGEVELHAIREHRFNETLSRLDQLVAADSLQRSRVDRIRQIDETWRIVGRDPAIRQRNELDAPFPLDEAISRREVGAGFVDRIDGILSEIMVAETERLNQRAESVSKLKRAAVWLIGLGGAVGVLAASAFAILGVIRSRALVLANGSLREEVSERQRAQADLGRASRQNALILEAAGDGICGLDLRGRVTFLNPAAEELLGVREAEVMSNPGATVMYRSAAEGPKGSVETSPVYASLQDGEVHQTPLDTFWREDGTSFPVEYTTRPILEDGVATGCVLTFRDITERREVEKMKDEFISVVSHELRTPLTSIRGSLGLLASGKLGTLQEQGQRMLEIAAQNTDRLVRLINDILDIERIESGTITMQPRVLGADRLMLQAVESIQGIADKSGVRLEVTPPNAAVWADPDRVEQVLTNLLSNAVKFSDPGTTITLSASKENGMLQFTVSDQGRGIPESKRESIFERFQQVDASDSREKGGTGLGLAIARSIVQQHGGEIWVESEMGLGSSFHFTVPLRNPTEVRQRSWDRPTILVCDDDDITLEVVGERLRLQGYHVLLARSGEEAIAIAALSQPDAVLLDLVMPGMGGCETMVALKQQPETKEIPILIFSSTPPNGLQPELAGAAAWVTKSAGEETLFSALERVLSRENRIRRIFLVEDDLDLAEVLITMFEKHGVEAIHADSYASAVRLSADAEPDLLILDIVLREGDAFELVDHLRRDDRLRSIPLMVYSAMDLDDSQRDRLRLGHTEFVTKGRITPVEFEQRVIELLDDLLLSREGVAA